MARYRKKPVVIEAILVSELTDGSVPLPLWYLEAVQRGKVVEMTDGHLGVYTLEGSMTAEPTDYLIRGVKGELYPCKPDIFQATYDPVPDDED